MQVLSRLRKLLGGNGTSERVTADSFDLTDKPYAKSLLSNFVEEHEQTKDELRRMVGRLRPVSEPSTMAEYVKDASCTLAQKISAEAAKRTGRSPVFLPGEPIPKYAPWLVAYTLFVLAEIRDQLREEQVELDFRVAAVDTASAFFMLHSQEERTANVLAGWEAFQHVAREGGDNLHAWTESLRKLLCVYVLQLTAEPPESEGHDLIGLFGGLLSSFLAAVE